MAAHGARDFNFVQMSDRRIHGGKVFLNDGIAALSVGFLNGALDGGDRFLARQHAADGEEAGLHDGVDAAAHSRLPRDRISVDHVKFQFLFQNLLLHFARQMVPDLIGGEGRIQQERCARFGRAEDVRALHERKLVAGDKAGSSDQIGGFDRLGAEAQMRDRDRSRFFRVVHEISLRMIGRVFPDNFDRVFVCADGAVRTQSIKNRAHRARIFR